MLSYSLFNFRIYIFNTEIVLTFKLAEKFVLKLNRFHLHLCWFKNLKSSFFLIQLLYTSIQHLFALVSLINSGNAIANTLFLIVYKKYSISIIMPFVKILHTLLF